MPIKNIFSDTFYELKRYAENHGFSDIEKKIEAANLGVISKSYMIKLFKSLEKNELKIVNEKNVTLEVARKILMTEMSRKKIKDHVMEQNRREEKLSVKRSDERKHIIEISGTDVIGIKGFIKSIGGVYNPDEKKWLLDGTDKKVNQVAAQLGSKIIEKNIQNKQKEAYFKAMTDFSSAEKSKDENAIKKAQEALEKATIKYGASIILYRDNVSRDYLAKEILKIEQRLSNNHYVNKNDKAMDIGLHAHNGAALIAAQKLIDLGFCQEKTSKKNPENTFVNFTNFVVKKALIENIEKIGNDSVMKEIAKQANEKFLNERNTQKTESIDDMTKKLANSKQAKIEKREAEAKKEVSETTETSKIKRQK